MSESGTANINYQIVYFLSFEIIWNNSLHSLFHLWITCYIKRFWIQYSKTCVKKNIYTLFYIKLICWGNKWSLKYYSQTTCEYIQVDKFSERSQYNLPTRTSWFPFKLLHLTCLYWDILRVLTRIYYVSSPGYITFPHQDI